MPAIFRPPSGSKTTASDPTGGSDASAKINAELASLPSGGTLALPPGYYRCDSQLIVPAGVAIVGTWRGYAAAMKKAGITDLHSYGTVLVNNVTTTATAKTDSCFITLADYSTLEGMAIFDAKQGLPGTTAVARMFQVGTNYGTQIQGPDSPVVRRVSILNAWYGVRMWGAYRFVLEDVLVNACRAGFDVDCVFDTSRINRCHVIPTYWCNTDTSVPAAIQTDILANLVAYRFGRVDSVLVSQSMVYLAATGMLFNQSTQTISPNAPWVRIESCDLDVTVRGIDLQYSALQSVRFTGVGITTPNTSTAERAVVIGANAAGYGFTNCSFQAQNGHEVDIGGGTGSFTGCAVNSFGIRPNGSTASINVAGGNVTVTGCTFEDARPQIANTGSGKAALVGCLTSGGQNITGTVTTSGNN